MIKHNTMDGQLITFPKSTGASANNPIVINTLQPSHSKTVAKPNPAPPLLPRSCVRFSQPRNTPATANALGPNTTSTPYKADNDTAQVQPCQTCNPSAITTSATPTTTCTRQYIHKEGLGLACRQACACSAVQAGISSCSGSSVITWYLVVGLGIFTMRNPANN